jgi:hypothetical protein
VRLSVFSVFSVVRLSLVVAEGHSERDRAFALV